MQAKQYHKLLHELCHVMQEGVHIVNAAGITVIYNEAMAALEKTKREEVLGKPFREVFANIPEDESTLTRALKHRMATERQPQTYLNKNGKEISTINTTIPVLDYDKNIIAAIEIAKDVTEIRELSHTILELKQEYPIPRTASGTKIRTYVFSDIIGKSKNFTEVLQKAQRAAKSSASVLICGETGTGKELFAQSIHFDSDRKARPFLAQNCAAIPESLLEGMLFGTSKGGFTGALDRQGFFEQANGGTLLLDEISAMPFALQSKLLRVLQERYIRRVGGTKDIPIDVRIIATINEDPKALIESGRLRKDLYYRLKIIEISIPPLRERPDDILVLAESFLDKYNEKFGKQIWMLSDDAKNRLLAYDFPGNARELENIIMSAVALSSVEHVLSGHSLDIPEKASGFSGGWGGWGLKSLNGATLSEYIEAAEKKIVLEAFANNGGNISKTAHQLGMNRQNLQYKLRKYNR
ncbi:MAG: sigma 54-interacting transcriptional regulator [Clostridiales bacterium]|nr:sigma 54-interacting transcriptional regulator [Clostridiales bacterium]